MYMLYAGEGNDIDPPEFPRAKLIEEAMH